jgi:CheY-like chemotaxis protein
MFKENMEKKCCPIRFKFVLTDLNMPNLDGVEAAKQIVAYQRALERIDPDRRWVPIIAVTAYEDEDTLNKCLSVGISKVINKPVSFEKLNTIVNDFYFGQVGQNL